MQQVVVGRESQAEGASVMVNGHMSSVFWGIRKEGYRQLLTSSQWRSGG